MTFPRALARSTRGAVNTMTLHLAGHAAFADLEHTGRRSGIVRHTPVRAFRAGDTVIIGLNFGRHSDWYQNIKASGTCRMRLGGEQLTPRHARTRARQAGRPGHAPAVQLRAQARGSHGRLRPASHRAFIARPGHPALALSMARASAAILRVHIIGSAPIQRQAVRP